MKKFLVQKNIDGEIFPRLMSENELIDYISMDDCHNEDYAIFDCSSFGEVREVHYAGWRPGGLIEIIDKKRDVVVLKGYGEEH